MNLNVIEHSHKSFKECPFPFTLKVRKNDLRRGSNLSDFESVINLYHPSEQGQQRSCSNYYSSQANKAKSDAFIHRISDLQVIRDN